MNWRQLLLGRPLATYEHSERKLGAIAGLPAIGLDGLASSAYGPEAALLVLMIAGAAGLSHLPLVMLLILFLLAVLYFSYRQTIAAYPSGGGAYAVAQANLGENVSLLAAAALIVDYILNAAVGVSAGVAALVSAFPTLHPHTLTLCLSILALITLVNLRGTIESGWAFAIPTYLFVACFALVIGGGAWKMLSSNGAPTPVTIPPPLPQAAGAITIWVLMRSFASGCTAMTGIEAVSNGMTAFRDPPVKHARRTLTMIVVILGLLLGGVTLLAHAYRVGAMDQSQAGYQSVLSQVVGAVYGRGATYYLSMASLICVLCLSANTSFVGFPRLCRLIAADDYLPRAFTIVGRRLVYSIGIAFLSACAGLLLVVFNGITEHLIPLFAVGAFMAFTISQLGMVVHWSRLLRETGASGGNGKHAFRGLVINAVGLSVTALATVIILIAKFAHGAWIAVVAMPGLIALFKLVKRHYLKISEEVTSQGPLELHGLRQPLVVLAIEEWDQRAAKALSFAMRLSGDVIAVHIADFDDEKDEARARELRSLWERNVQTPVRRAGMSMPALVLLYSPFRKFIDPLLSYFEKLGQEHPNRLIAVVVPEFVKQHWWHYILHGYRAQRLRRALIRSGKGRAVVITVPWYLEDVADHTSEPEGTVALDVTNVPAGQIDELAEAEVQSVRQAERARSVD